MGDSSDVIQARLLGNISSGYDKSEGSFFYDAEKAVAIEFESAYQEIDSVQAKFNVDNLSGDDLTTFVYQRTGIERKPATAATATVTISGQTGSKIKVGDLVAAGLINFTASEDKTIDATGQMQVLVQCQAPGVAGNVPAGAIKNFPVTIPGLVQVTNPDPVTNGYDAESDPDLRERYYDKLQNPGKSGNAAHYLEWAKEVIGVGDARVFPRYNGPLTMKVVIIDANKLPADSNLIQAVNDHITEEMPFGVQTLSVISATALDINAQCSLTIDTANYTQDQVIANIKSSITGYLQGIAFQSTYASFAKIGECILNSAGVLDYSNLTVNGGTANVLIGNEEVAVTGTVTIV